MQDVGGRPVAHGGGQLLGRFVVAGDEDGGLADGAEDVEADAQLPADVPDQSDQRSPLPAEPALDARAQRGSEVGAFARCRDGDQQRIPPDDGGHDEAALRGPVDDVDEDAGRLRLLPAATIDLCVFAGVDDEAGAGEIAGPVLARWDDLDISAGLT